MVRAQILQTFLYCFCSLISYIKTALIVALSTGRLESTYQLYFILFHPLLLAEDLFRTDRTDLK